MSNKWRKVTVEMRESNIAAVLFGIAIIYLAVQTWMFADKIYSTENAKIYSETSACAGDCFVAYGGLVLITTLISAVAIVIFLIGAVLSFMFSGMVELEQHVKIKNGWV